MPRKPPPRPPYLPGEVVWMLPGESPSDAARRVEGERWHPSTGLPTDSEARKKLPIATGVVDYFPLALAALAELSRIGNDTHNPGEPLHWSRGKSDDHPDALMRHFIERGKIDTNGVRHSAQVAWRALAILQLELENARTRPGREWRQGDAVRARHWPEMPSPPKSCNYPDCDGGPATGYCTSSCRTLVELPCDVEPCGHGEGGL